MKLFIFDVDGVLRDSGRVGEEGMRRGFKAVGIDSPFTLEDYRTIRSVGVYNNSRKCITLMLALINAGKRLGEVEKSEQAFDSLIAKRPPDQETIDRIRKVYKHFFYSKEAGKLVRVLPGVGEALDLLKKKGFTLAIWTNSSLSAVERDLKPFLHSFAYLLCGEDVKIKKPDPKGIELICEKLGVPLAETAYIGDTGVDVQAAKKAGCVSIILESTVPDRAVMRKEKADFYFENILEMAHYFSP